MPEAATRRELTPPEVRRLIGARMRAARASSGMTKPAIVQRIREISGTGSEQELERWEAGRGIPSLHRFRIWAQATGADVAVVLAPESPSERRGRRADG